MFNKVVTFLDDAKWEKATQKRWKQIEEVTDNWEPLSLLFSPVLKASFVSITRLNNLLPLHEYKAGSKEIKLPVK